MKIDKNQQYIQVSKVAKMLDCSPEFVRQLIRDNELIAINLKQRATRVSLDSLLNFIEKSKVDPAAYYE